MDKSGELSLAELYGLIRGQIDHEDDLVSQRVLWALLTQAFFFGAYVALLNAPREAKNSIFEAELTLFLWLLPTTALLTGLLAYVGILSSLKSVAYLRHLYKNQERAKTSDDHSSKLYPDMQGLPHLRKMAFLTPALMPMIFNVAWLIVLGRLLIAWL